MLSAGRLELALAPQIGGSIARMEWLGEDGRTPVLRGAPDILDDPLDAGCFPLVPFANRIADGTFRFAGKTIVLRPNVFGEANVIHGQGWRRPWRMTGSDGMSAELVFLHEAQEWPRPMRRGNSFVSIPPDLRRDSVAATSLESRCRAGWAFTRIFPVSAQPA